MGFKNALSALVLALPLVAGTFILVFCRFGKANARLYAGLRTRRTTCPDGVHTAINAACCKLFPVVQDLTENLFEKECGDGVSAPVPTFYCAFC